jgi:hypothetical protein
MNFVFPNGRPVRSCLRKALYSSSATPSARNPAQSSTIFSNGGQPQAHPHIPRYGPRTIPGIFSWVGRQLCREWIQFNISLCYQQIMLIHHLRCKAPLPQMAPPVLSKIYMPDITSMPFPDRPSKSFSKMRNGDTMNMIGHEAVGPDGNITPRTPLSHKPYVHRVIILAEKGLVSAVPSLS